MKIQIKKSLLKDIIFLTDGFIAKNYNLPVLGNIKMVFKKNGCLYYATDMEGYQQIRHGDIDRVQIIEEGSITITKSFLRNILPYLSDDVELETQEKRVVKISSGNAVYLFNYIDPNDHVSLAEVKEEDAKKVIIPGEIFTRSFQSVLYSITSKNFAPVLTGVFIKIRNNKLFVVGTDSFRLSEYTAIIEKQEDISLILPCKYMNNILKITKKKQSDITIHTVENLTKLSYTFGDLSIDTIVLNIQGNYPEYDREEIIPKEGKIFIELLSEDICFGIGSVCVMTRDINNFIDITANAQELMIRSGKTEKGTSQVTVKGECNVPVQFAINGKYIKEFVKNTRTEFIRIQIVDSQHPIVLTCETENLKYIIRPLINN